VASAIRALRWRWPESGRTRRRKEYQSLEPVSWTPRAFRSASSALRIGQQVLVFVHLVPQCRQGPADRCEGGPGCTLLSTRSAPPAAVDSRKRAVRAFGQVSVRCFAGSAGHGAMNIAASWELSLRSSLTNRTLDPYTREVLLLHARSTGAGARSRSRSSPGACIRSFDPGDGGLDTHRGADVGQCSDGEER
jgi:hypothetical protein